MAKISVIIPCYNQGEYLEEALRSVFSQVFKDFEIVVVNDGSDSISTLNIIETLREKYSSSENIKFVDSENKGPSAARNLGIESASGDFILPLDADDKLDSDYLDKTFAKINTDESIGLVCTHTQTFGSENWIAKTVFDPKKILFENQTVTTCLYRKSDWEKVGGYDEDMKSGWEDYDFTLSMFELGKTIEIIPEPLFFYRKYPKDYKKATSNSMRSITPGQELELRLDLVRKHKKLYADNLEYLIEQIHHQKYSIMRLERELRKSKPLWKKAAKRLISIFK